jgi:hypothetical protein
LVAAGALLAVALPANLSLLAKLEPSSPLMTAIVGQPKASSAVRDEW